MQFGLALRFVVQFWCIGSDVSVAGLDLKGEPARGCVSEIRQKYVYYILFVGVQKW